MEKKTKITPWEVKGKIEYKKIANEFGLKIIDEDIKEKIKKIAKEIHILIRRGYFFAHRDLDLVLKDYENGKKFFLYTGRAPSGPMHIGHLIPFILTKWLQEKFEANVYIEIPDEEKFVAGKAKLEEIEYWTKDNLLDIAALNFDEDKTFIFLTSEYIKNIYKLAIRISSKINFSTAKAIFGFTNQSNIGIIFYPAIQLAPTFFEDCYCLIPASLDQDPYWRLQRDIAEKLNGKKSAQITSKFLVPLTGIEGKMSSSDPKTAIFLNDSEEEVKEKIFKYAFSGGQPTIELHRKLGGNPEIDVCFQWLYAFFEEDDKKIEEIKEKYKGGELLTGELKEYTSKKISEFLKEHQKRKKHAEDKLRKYMYEGKLANEMLNKIYS
ncbi:MAG: tryptophan--tRNA ligase [Candidatus Aenigmatarchaeota archaeon]